MFPSLLKCYGQGNKEINKFSFLPRNHNQFVELSIIYKLDEKGKWFFLNFLFAFLLTNPQLIKKV